MEQRDSHDRRKIVKGASDSVFESGDSDEYQNRPHMCETCGKRFTLLENLNRHQMIHTDVRPFPCTYCSKRFRLAQHLKEHIRIHTGEKPYECPTCGRAFCQISNLKSHQKTHTKIKAFKCDICDKCFRRAFTLKQHKLTHVRRSYPGDIRATGGVKPGYHSLSGKHSAPAQMLGLAESSLHRRHFLSETIPNKASNGRFVAKPSVGSYTEEFLIPSSSSNLTPHSAPARIAPDFVPSSVAASYDHTSPSRTSTDISQCPSLSALLRTDCDARVGVLSSWKNVASSSASSNYYQSAVSIITDPDSSAGITRNQHAAGLIGERELDYRSASDYACVHCNRFFANGTDLRNHTINDHSRKDTRRDSAYSSHSDKSPTTSPSFGTNVYGSAGPRCASDDISVPHSKSRCTDDPILKRVTELALISLGRYNSAPKESSIDRTFHEKKRIGNIQRSDTEKRESDISLEVGHSPTEANEEMKSRENEQGNLNSHDQETKIVKRGFCGSKKWKRELCKEWYEVPEQPNMTEKTVPPKVCEVAENTEPERKRLREECPDTSDNTTPADGNDVGAKDPPAASPKIDSNQTSTPASGYQHRFAPIIEWKPVVTGWKDMLCGTLYALPPHAQHGYLQSLYDPRMMYPPPKSGESKIESESAYEGHVAEDEIQNTENESSPRYFRFSPHILANLATDIESLPGSATDSALSGVYSYVYPPETLPIPGYSRLQHALLHNWDPNRNRLGGTSSVPQTPNLVSAT